MPYTPPNVYYATTFDGTYTKLDGVESVSISRGKQRFQDSVGASQCVIEIVPTSTLPANITIGQFIDIRDSNSGSSSAYFVGKITDVERKYSIPYNAVTGAAPGDRLTITVAGGVGVMASGYGAVSPTLTTDAAYSLIIGTMGVANVYCITPQNIGWTAPNTVNPIGINVINPGGDLFAPQLSPWLETVNKLLNTIQYSIDDLDLNRTPKTNGFVNTVYFGAYCYPTGQTGKLLSFVDDGTTGASVYKYSQIEFMSSVQSAFTQVVIESDLDNVEVVSGSRPYTGFSLPTAIATTAQGTPLGQYVLTTNASITPVPFTIGTNSAIQNDVAQLGKLAECPIGTAVILKFRGATYYATVSAIAVEYTPEIANVRLTFTPSLGTPFTLNSTAFGVLNTNRLGFP